MKLIFVFIMLPIVFAIREDKCKETQNPSKEISHPKINGIYTVGITGITGITCVEDDEREVNPKSNTICDTECKICSS